MQAGFGMLEAGSVQEKNHRSILFKVRVKQA
jgi:ammonia channel protein AmtB